MNSVAHPPSRLPSSQGNQLRIGIDCDPYPHVASDPLFGHLGRNVALLGVAEAPRFVSLQPFALQIPHGGVEVYGASGAISTSSFRTVFLATPLMRTVLLIELPSTRQRIT